MGGEKLHTEEEIEQAGELSAEMLERIGELGMEVTLSDTEKAELKQIWQEAQADLAESIPEGVQVDYGEFPDVQEIYTEELMLALEQNDADVHELAVSARERVVQRLQQLVLEVTMKAGDSYAAGGRPEADGISKSPEEQAKADLAALEQKAMEAGYKNAQREIAMILNGRSLEQYTADADAGMEQLSEEIEKMEQAHYDDPDMKAWQERNLEDARRTLQSMDRKYRMIQGLQNGELVGPNEYLSEEEILASLANRAAGGEVDDLNPNVITQEMMDEAAVKRAAELLGDRRILKRYKKQQARRREVADARREEGFAESPEGAGGPAEEERQEEVERQRLEQERRVNERLHGRKGLWWLLRRSK